MGNVGYSNAVPAFSPMTSTSVKSDLDGERFTIPMNSMAHVCSKRNESTNNSFHFLYVSLPCVLCK